MVSVYTNYVFHMYDFLLHPPNGLRSSVSSNTERWYLNSAFLTDYFADVQTLSF